jgi:hypothetical protein
VNLGQELADELAELVSDTRTSVITLAKRASTIRAEYLDSDRGKYDPDFRRFWKSFGMDSRFGTLANFTKYALAGEAVTNVRRATGGSEDRYPTSLRALYELSLLTPEEIALCLENTFSRTEITDDRDKWTVPSPARALITPSVTGAAIVAWRKQWRDPQPTVQENSGVLIAEIRFQPENDRANSSSATPLTEGQICALIEELTSVAKRAGAFKVICIQQLVDRQIARAQRQESKQLAKKRGWEDRVAHALSSEFKQPSKKVKFSPSRLKLLHDLGINALTVDDHKGVIGPITPEEYRKKLAEEYFRLLGPSRFLNLLYRHGRIDPLMMTEEEEREALYLNRRYDDQKKIWKRLNQSKNREIKQKWHNSSSIIEELEKIEKALPATLLEMSDKDISETAKRYINDAFNFKLRNRN